MEVYTPSPILVFCNANENGNFSEALIGKRVIPDKQYDYFFTTEDEEILITPEKFKVQNGELVKINLT